MPETSIARPETHVINGVTYHRAEGFVIDGVIFVADDGGDELLTVNEIRELTGKGITTINRAMNDGRIPYSVPNGCEKPRRAWRSDVMRWMEGGADV